MWFLTSATQEFCRKLGSDEDEGTTYACKEEEASDKGSVCSSNVCVLSPV